jgi:hypothetical protein
MEVLDQSLGLARDRKDPMDRVFVAGLEAVGADNGAVLGKILTLVDAAKLYRNPSGFSNCGHALAVQR